MTCVFHLQYSFAAHDEKKIQLLAQLIAMHFQCGVKLSFVGNRLHALENLF